MVVDKCDSSQINNYIVNNIDIFTFSFLEFYNSIIEHISNSKKFKYSSYLLDEREILFNVFKNFTNFIYSMDLKHTCFRLKGFLNIKDEQKIIFCMLTINYKPIDLLQDISAIENTNAISSDEINNLKMIYENYLRCYFYLKNKTLNKQELKKILDLNNVEKCSIPKMIFYFMNNGITYQSLFATERKSKKFGVNIMSYEEERDIYDLACDYKWYNNIFIGTKFATRLKQILSLENEQDIIAYMENNNYKPCHFYDDFDDAQAHRSLSEVETKKAKDIYKIYLQNYPSKNELDKFLNWIKEDYDVKKLKDYIVNIMMTENRALYESIKKHQSLYSDEDRELLYDVIYDYNKYCYTNCNGSGYAFHMDKILSFKNGTDIFNYLIHINFTPADLENSIISARKSQNFSEKQLIRLKKIYELYFKMYPTIKENNKVFFDNIQKHNRLEEKNEKYKNSLPQAKEIVQNYLISDFTTVDEYISKLGIKRSYFEYCLDVLEYFSDPIYKKYKNFSKKNLSKRYCAIVANGKKICHLIIEGVKDNDNQCRDVENLTSLIIITQHHLTSRRF